MVLRRRRTAPRQRRDKARHRPRIEAAWTSQGRPGGIFMSSGGVQTLVSKGFAALRLNQARARKSFSRSTTYVHVRGGTREAFFGNARWFVEAVGCEILLWA